MSLTSTANTTESRRADAMTAAGTCPDLLVRAVRAEVRRGLGWQQTADGVARVLRAGLPDPAAILPAAARRGDVYGADISRLGNSIRREYTLPLHP
jgi:hypothetical protein